MIFILLLTIFSFSQTIFADEMLSKHAEHVLNRVAYALPSPSIIGKREWDELQLDRLVTILDRTTTSFGRWGLVQLLHPIADETELLQRKQIITFLIEHEDEMRIFQEQLEQVHAVEKSLLAYWDKHDRLNQSAEQFYYSFFAFKDLNKSSLALNASTFMEIFNSWKYLLVSLALGGVSEEFSRWIYSDKPDDKFDIIGGLRAGVAGPLRKHSLEPYYLKNPRPLPYTVKDYTIAMLYGSPADIYTIAKEGYTVPEKDFWFFKKAAFKAPGSGQLGAFVNAIVPTLFFDYQWGNAIVSASKRLLSVNRTLNSLQARVADVAQCVQAVKKLRAIVDKQAPELSSYLLADDYDRERADFIKNLLARRFLEKPGYLYSRGHVLTEHLEIVEKKKTLIPLLHSVALLDAYCSIAQLYKESQNESVVFSFPEFVDSPTPLLEYHDAWLPLLSYDQAVSNDLFFGGGKPSKIIITGPNGGGKSTVLKAYGVGSVLAQSWCIVPAKNARQTLFASIKTSLAPHEQLQQGLSTFMAEKKVMTELLNDIRHSDAEHPMFVLIDEPYKGTVDAESAKRIYEFGKDIAAYPYALVAIATHVKKPIFLEKDTGGIFGNYQVRIEETRSGIFKRLFKIQQGPANWWFEDGNKRSRFVDWLSVSGDSGD